MCCPAAAERTELEPAEAAPAKADLPGEDSDAAEPHSPVAVAAAAEPEAAQVRLLYGGVVGGVISGLACRHGLPHPASPS